MLKNQKLKEVQRMPVVKIGPKHQVTIPKEIFTQLHLQPGDFLQTAIRKGKIIMVPKQLTVKAIAPSLTKEEQKMIGRVKEKINKIQTDIINSKGLNNKEIELAVKLGFIDIDQAWWWKEGWQKGERKAEKDIEEGRLSGPFDNVEDLMAHLDRG